MSNVFISYAKEDAATARMLSDALQRAGFSVWWDRHIPPGKTWDDVIGRSLDAALASDFEKTGIGKSNCSRSNAYCSS